MTTRYYAIIMAVWRQEGDRKHNSGVVAASDVVVWASTGLQNCSKIRWTAP